MSTSNNASNNVEPNQEMKELALESSMILGYQQRKEDLEALLADLPEPEEDAEGMSLSYGFIPGDEVGVVLDDELIQRKGWTCAEPDILNYIPRCGAGKRAIVPFVGMAYILSTFVLETLPGEETPIFGECPFEAYNARWQNNSGSIPMLGQDSIDVEKFNHTFSVVNSAINEGETHLGIGHPDAVTVYFLDRINGGELCFSEYATADRKQYKGQDPAAFKAARDAEFAFYVNLSGDTQKNGGLTNKQVNYNLFRKELATKLHDAGAPLGVNCQILLAALVENAYIMEEREDYDKPCMVLTIAGFKPYFKVLHKPMRTPVKSFAGKASLATRFRRQGSNGSSAFERMLLAETKEVEAKISSVEEANKQLQQQAKPSGDPLDDFGDD